MGYQDGQFRCLSSVKRSTFCVRVGVLNEAQSFKIVKGGHPGKLTIIETLLMTLEYMRE